MKAWDTNVLVRHLTEDDPAQLKTARAELAKAAKRGEPIWISLLVAVETAWVLTAYGLKKTEILEVLESVTRDGRFHIEHGTLLAEAVRRAGKRGDLPEHVAALVAKRSAVSKTQTFDLALKSFPEFEVLR